jgi:hypothetical protein
MMEGINAGYNLYIEYVIFRCLMARAKTSTGVKNVTVVGLASSHR